MVNESYFVLLSKFLGDHCSTENIFFIIIYCNYFIEINLLFKITAKHCLPFLYGLRIK